MARKILFAGTPEIAVPSLKALIKDPEIEVMGVMCPPDKKVGRKQILTSCAVKKEALESGLLIFEVENKQDVLKVYQKTKPELVVVIALGVIFPEEALNLAPTVNVHFSLLPQWRGASPVQSAILAGDKTSGITLQKMKKELDAGDILWQKEFLIENKTTGQLWTEWAQETADVLPTLVKTFESLPSQAQDESRATFCGKFEKSDGEIFPERETSEEIERKYRAFDIWPGIFLQTKQGPVKISECSLKVNKNGVELPCKTGSIWIQTLQLAGKSPASALDVLRGRTDLFLRE